MLIYMNKTLSGRLRERKNKRKAKLGSPKSAHGRLPEHSLTSAFITMFNKRGFTMVIVTRAGRLREWSQGELRLYYMKKRSIRPQRLLSK